MSNTPIILGGAQTDFARNWSKEGKSFVAMLREVVEDGMAAVGMEYDEIKRLNDENRVAVYVGNFDMEQYSQQGHLGAFLTEVNPAFYGVPGARYEAACASGSVALNTASSQLRAGDYDVAVVVGIEVMKTVSSAVGGDFLGTAAYYEKEAKGIEFPFPKLFGKLADVIVERTSGVAEDRIMQSLAEISRINYDNAKRNPKAQTRTWFMDREHANTRGGDFNMSVSGRLCITDCSQVTDGAAFMVLATPEYARDFAKRKGKSMKDFAAIKGWGHRVAPIQFTDKVRESAGNEYILPWTRQAVVDAYRRAGLDVNRMDVFETHDCFTSSEYAAVSAFGISGPGKEHEAIEDGKIDFKGAKPINPSGGLIGAGHPVGASGVRMALDIYKQVTDQAGDYQVGGAKNGLMLNIGGSATTSMTFVIGQVDE
ncbi:MAG: acetyl-CoA acetyltransferase [Leptospiraceae bacterium]|nr:acetyl-CoA acetyltransferase [Leptospiraceae bacterium]